ncbi:MAG: patatin-like phospholipase family protein, partial [Bacteroidota bacterium]
MDLSIMAPKSICGDSPATQNKLKAKDIGFVVFEGGGGKGAAYLGAIVALEQAGVFDRLNKRQNAVKGFAGASAGSILAFLCSIGLGPKEILEEFKSGIFANMLSFRMIGRRPSPWQDGGRIPGIWKVPPQDRKEQKIDFDGESTGNLEAARTRNASKGYIFARDGYLTPKSIAIRESKKADQIANLVAYERSRYSTTSTASPRNFFDSIKKLKFEEPSLAHFIVSLWKRPDFYSLLHFLHGITNDLPKYESFRKHFLPF